MRTSSPPSSAVRWGAIALLGTLGFVAFLLFVAGARLDAGTAGLSVAAAALVFSLATLYRMVQVLARPGRTLAPRAHELAGADRSLLREEKRRLLRAINELKFDFEMGKLSEADYTSVKQTYELRAVEVMRKLDGAAQVHPEVYALLEDRGLEGIVPEASKPEPKTEEAAESEESKGEETAEPEEAPKAEEASESEEAPKSEEAAESDDAPKADAQVACAACDGMNDADAKFCKHCGKELSA